MLTTTPWVSFEEVELIYSFTVRDSLTPPATSSLQGGSDRYVKLRVRRDEIKETITSEKPSFDASSQTLASQSTRPGR